MSVHLYTLELGLDHNSDRPERLRDLGEGVSRSRPHATFNLVPLAVDVERRCKNDDGLVRVEADQRGDAVLRTTEKPTPQRRIAVRVAVLRIDPNLDDWNVLSNRRRSA